MSVLRYALYGAGLSILLLFTAAYVERNATCFSGDCVWHGANSFSAAADRAAMVERIRNAR